MTWGLFRELNQRKVGFTTLQRSIYRHISIFLQKIVYKVSDSVLVLFTDCENVGIESFLFSRKPIAKNLSAICEPFSTASLVGRELRHRGQLKPLWTIFEPPVTDI